MKKEKYTFTDNVFKGEDQISGNVEGTVVAEIRGICSIKDYVIDSISKHE